MKYLIIGVESKKGTYQNISYDNTVLHTISDLESSKGFGKACYTVSLKTSILDNYLKSQGIKASDLVSSKYYLTNVLYDKYRKVAFIEFEK